MTHSHIPWRMHTLHDSCTRDMPHFISISFVPNSTAAMQGTGWWGCIGCINLQVSFRRAFRRKATNYRAFLQKITCRNWANLCFFATLYAFSLTLTLTNKHTHAFSTICKITHSPTQIVCAKPYRRGGGLGSSTIFKKFNEPYDPS